MLASDAARHRIASGYPGRRTAITQFVDQAYGQPGKTRVGVGRTGPRERDARRVGLRAQLGVEVPHHLDVVGNESDRADDDGRGAGVGQRREVIGDIRL